MLFESVGKLTRCFLQGNDVTEEDCSSPSYGKGNYGNHLCTRLPTQPHPSHGEGVEMQNWCVIGKTVALTKLSDDDNFKIEILPGKSKNEECPPGGAASISMPSGVEWELLSMQSAICAHIGSTSSSSVLVKTADKMFQFNLLAGCEINVKDFNFCLVADTCPNLPH